MNHLKCDNENEHKGLLGMEHSIVNYIFALHGRFAFFLKACHKRLKSKETVRKFLQLLFYSFILPNDKIRKSISYVIIFDFNRQAFFIPLSQSIFYKIYFMCFNFMAIIDRLATKNKISNL